MLTAATHPQAAGERTAFRVLGAISFCHLLNDMVQSLIPALYPVLKASYGLEKQPSRQKSRD